MPMPTLQQIIGTITGKVAFERTQANFTTIKTTHDALETVVGTKAPNADLVAHKAESANKAHGGFKGVLVTKNIAQSIPNNVPTTVVWQTEVYDTSNSFDIANPSRLTVPIGVNKVVLKANGAWVGNATGYRSIQILRNSTNTVVPQESRGADGTRSYSNISSPVINVVAGDYFEMSVTQTSGGALDFYNNPNCWFSMEVVE